MHPFIHGMTVADPHHGCVHVLGLLRAPGSGGGAPDRWRYRWVAAARGSMGVTARTGTGMRWYVVTLTASRVVD